MGIVNRSRTTAQSSVTQAKEDKKLSTPRITLKSNSAMKTMMPYESRMARRGTPLDAVRLVGTASVRASYKNCEAVANVLDEVVRGEAEVSHSSQKEAVFGHLGDVDAKVAEQRTAEEPRAQTGAGDLLGDHGVVAISPQTVRRLVDARRCEERYGVSESNQPNSEHHSPWIRLPWRIDLTRVCSGRVESTVAPVQDTDQLTPPRGIADDEPVGRFNLRKTHHNQHDERSDHR